MPREVLKRSRTSGSILQAALYYLEAIRTKVPEILQQEKMGIRAHYQPETKILPATEAELAHEAELAALEDAQAIVVDSVEQLVSDDLKTVRVTDGENNHFDSMQHILEEDRASISSLVAEHSHSCRQVICTFSLPEPAVTSALPPTSLSSVSYSCIQVLPGQVLL